MSDSSLQSYLNQELEQAAPDSTGVFTLDPEAARSKRARYQLEGSEIWGVKLVQAAVVAGATKIAVRLREKEAQFTLSGPLDWECLQLEASLLDPQPGPDRALWHLKQALWNVGLDGKRPFWLQPAGSPEELSWDGEKFQRQPARPGEDTVLRVSHIPAQSGALASWARAANSSINSQLLINLKRHAFVCPVPLDVDGLRLDALQFAPRHGISQNSLLVQIGFGQSDLPPLTVPRHTCQNPTPEGSCRDELEAVYQAPQQFPQQASLMTLLTAYPRPSKNSGNNTGFKAPKIPSFVYWVSDGVVVSEQELGIEPRSCSVGLIASAEGLTLDLSGFKVQQNAASRERITLLVREANPLVQAGQMDFSAYVSRKQSASRTGAGILAVVGLGLTWLAPPVGLFSLLASAVWRFDSSGAGDRVKDAQTDLEPLKSDWQRFSDSPPP